MKLTHYVIKTVIVSTLFFSHTAYALYDANEKCLAPKFRSFSPAEQVKGGSVPEVEPEAIVGFSVSGYADPTTIVATAKGISLDLNVVDRSSYYQVSIQLPADFNGKYVRIHLKAHAQKGNCKTKDGWLVKVK